MLLSHFLSFSSQINVSVPVQMAKAARYSHVSPCSIHKCGRIIHSIKRYILFYTNLAHCCAIFLCYPGGEINQVILRPGFLTILVPTPWLGKVELLLHFY